MTNNMKKHRYVIPHAEIVPIILDGDINQNLNIAVSGYTTPEESDAKEHWTDWTTMQDHDPWKQQ